MKSEKILLLDLDGTVANYDKAMKSCLQQIQSPDEKTYDHWDDNVPEWFKRRQYLIKEIPNWWTNLETIPAGIHIMNMAKDIGFKIHVLSKGPKINTRAWTEKVNWVNQNLNGIVDNISITFDKSFTYGTVLFDDYPDYMSRWLKWRPRGIGIMLASQINDNFSHPNVLKYISDVDDNRIKDALIKAYERN